MRDYLSFWCCLPLFLFISKIQAHPLINIETVLVGDAGNAADSTGYGAVADVFAIGKYEVTISQYSTFLNSVASVPTAAFIDDLYIPNMGHTPNIAGISRSGAGTPTRPYSYSIIGSGNRPITYVNWFDAARFANWMHNGATNGADTETGAYTLSGATAGIILKNPDARWWIPSEDEWYKAAYYKAGGTNSGYWLYPTQSDAQPGNVVGGATNQANYWRNNGSELIYSYSVTQSSNYSESQNYLTDVGAFSNSASAYGTFDQGGNVQEWNDAVVSGGNRGRRGGDWDSGLGSLASLSQGQDVPTAHDFDTGFRLAMLPEPSSLSLLLAGSAVLMAGRRRNRGSIAPKS